MSGESQSVDQATLEQTKQQIRALVHEIGQLSRADLAPERYYAEFLQRVIAALAAVGGAVWILDDQRRLKLAYQSNISQALLNAETEDAQRHNRLLVEVLNSRESRLVPPMSGGAEEGAAGNPTEKLLILSLLMVDNELAGLIEIFQRSDGSPATQRGYLRFVGEMSQQAGEWLKSRRLREFNERQVLWGQADQFARMSHESLDVALTAYTLVNEGRRLIGCDRVSLAIKKGRSCKIEAISGQDTIDARSNITSKMRELARRVMAAGEPLWYSGSTENLAPQVEEALEAYVEESHSKTVAVLPLHKPLERKHSSEAENAEQGITTENQKREVIGALIIEQIESNVPKEALAVRTSVVHEHGSRALSNALEYNYIPFMPVWRVVAKSRWLFRARTLPKTLLVTALLIAAAVALCIVPWDFRLKGKGALQPKNQREVFAAVEGKVVAVRCKHDQTVQEGEVLLELESPELEFRWKQISGEKEIADREVQTINDQAVRTLKSDDLNKLAARKALLVAKAQNLDEQLRVLEEQKKNLRITSPLSGKIVTWNADDLLRGRPVTVGQVLLTVADTKSDWEVEVFMPENRMGHIQKAADELKNNERLQARYIVATNPSRQLKATVRDVHRAAQLHEDDGHVVKLRLDINSKELEEPRPGASCTVDVYCGRRAIGYVWFHEVWEWIETHVLF